MIYIPEVELDTLCHVLDVWRSATASMDLRPTCDARLHVMPERIVGDELPILVIVRHGMRSRADHRHVPLDHVEQLRQLIDACLP